jgi:hypothetical protein
MIPDFRADGYLPDGLHIASEADVTFRLGSTGPVVGAWRYDFVDGLRSHDK